MHALSLAYLALLLLPGIAVLRLLGKRHKFHPLASTLVALGVTPLLGYASFWIFLFSKPAGRLFCYLVYLSAIAVLSTVRSRGFWNELRKGIARPVLLIAASAMLYLSLFWLYGTGGYGAALANNRFFDDERPGDNLIPLILADRIYSRRPVKPFCCGGWLSSDRPPLQTGVTLLLRPIRLKAAGNIDYQIVSTLLQCFSIAAIWSLFRATGISGRMSLQAVVLLILSGFLFYNSVYVWPKLLAAAFILLAFSILIRAVRLRRAIDRSDGFLAGCSIALALLAHPGSVFSLPALVLAASWNRRLIRRKVLAFAVAPCVSLLASWSAYPLWVDPPGNRLAKMHLAGGYDIDNRTLAQALHDSYGQRSLWEIAHNKLVNLTQLFGTDNQVRIAQSEYVLSSLGVLETGWLAVLLWSFRRKKLPRLRPLSWLLAGAIFNLIVWSLVLFGPGATFTTHSSYADILLLGLSLAAFFVSVMPRWCTWALAAWQVYNLYAVWALAPSKYLAAAPLEKSMLASAACITGALLWAGFFRRSGLPDREVIARTEHALLPAP